MDSRDLAAMSPVCRWSVAVCRALSLSVVVCLCLSCGSDLPNGTTQFTLGHTLVRTDSMLDVSGVVYRLRDTTQVPQIGPARHWLQALAPELNDSIFQAVRAPGP